MQTPPPEQSRTGRQLGRRRFLGLAATGAGAALIAVAGGCESSPDDSDISPVIQVMTVGVPVPFEVTVEVPVEVPVEVEVEKIVVQAVERVITPTPTQIPITEIDWWLPPLWKGLTGTETDAAAGYGDWPLAMIEQFHEIHPGIRVLPRVTSWTDHRGGLAAALTGGPGPDLFYEAAGSFRIYGIQGALQPVDPYVTLDGWRRFSGLARDQATMSGLALFFPFLLNATALLVNRQLFREVDAEEAIPVEGDRTWTFAEFRDAAARVGSTEAGRYAIAWPLGGAVGAYHHHSFLWGHGASLLSEDWRRYNLTGDEALAALTFLRDLAALDGGVLPDTDVQTLATLQEAFLAHRLAILPVSARTPGPIQVGISAGLVDSADYDLFPVSYPASPGLDPQAYSESSGFGIWWKPDRARMDAAAELGIFLSSPENQQYVTATSSFPVRGALAQPYTDPILTFMQESTKFAATDPLTPPYFAIGGTVSGLVTDVLTGDPAANPAPAMETAAERGQVAVDAYWDTLGF